MTSVKNRARHLPKMSMRAMRKDVAEYTDHELARLLEATDQEAGEAVEELTEALRDVDGAPTDDQVAALWEAVDAFEAAARTLTTRTAEATDDS